MKKLQLIYFLMMLPGIGYADTSEVSYNFNFSSSVTTNTCLIYINDNLANSVTSNSTSNVNINLPRVNSTLLESVGNVAGTTEMIISLKYCPSSQTKATLSLSSDQINSQTGNLINSFPGDNKASNVEVQLLNSEKNPILFNNGNKSYNFTLQKESVAGSSYLSGSMEFYLQYISLGNIKPGKVVSTLTYSISYD